MRTAIVDKVNHVILQDLNTEQDVLYVLAQMRKYLEASYSYQERSGKYPTTSLFCDWVLHSRLDMGGAQRTLKEYAEFFAQQAGDSIFEFFKTKFRLFSELKTELRVLCEEEGFNYKIINSREVWLNFVRNLVEILKDFPLESPGEISSFTFRNNIADLDGTNLVTFDIKFKNNRSIHSIIDLELIDYQE